MQGLASGMGTNNGAGHVLRLAEFQQRRYYVQGLNVRCAVCADLCFAKIRLP